MKTLIADRDFSYVGEPSIPAGATIDHWRIVQVTMRVSDHSQPRVRSRIRRALTRRNTQVLEIKEV